MVVELRDAVARDLPRICEIERKAYTTPWSLKSFERELTLPFSRILVASVREEKSAAEKSVFDNARVDGGLVGFLCRWIVADECHILNIAVHPDYSQHGVGFFM